MEWGAARNEVPGVVQKVHVRKGDKVEAGAPLIEVEMREAKAAFEAQCLNCHQTIDEAAGGWLRVDPLVPASATQGEEVRGEAAVASRLIADAA